MRRRFSRRRRGGSGDDGKAPAIDAAQALAGIVEAGIVAAPSLEVLQHDDVPTTSVAVGRGELADGTKLVVAFAPKTAADALLAGLATGARLAADEGFDGEVVAVAPQWSTAARRRLASLAPAGYRFRAVEAGKLGEGWPQVESDSAAAEVYSVANVVGQLANPATRELFARAAAALEGLASKHGGAVRGSASGVDLIVLARRVAQLRAEGDQVELLTLLPQRSSASISADDLAEGLDGLEGQLRRRLNDRRTRDGAEGMRARVISVLATAGGLRSVARWPLAGSEEEIIDLVGVASDGQVVLGAIREELGLAALAAILDAGAVIEPMLPTVLAGAEAPVKLGPAKLALAAKSFSPSVALALSALGVAYELFEVRAPRGRGFEVVPLGSGEVSQRPRQRAARAPEPRREAAEPQADASDAVPSSDGGRRRSRRPRASAPESRSDDDAAAATAAGSPESENGGVAADGPRTGARRRGGRSGRRGGRGRGSSAPRPEGETPAGNAGEAAPDSAVPPATPRFDQMSSFDLDNDAGNGDGSLPRRRGRSRSRGRRGSAGSDDETASEGDPSQPETEAGADASGDDSFLADDDNLTSLAAIPDDVSVPDVKAPAYDEEEEVGDESDAREHAATVQREIRRLARVAKSEPEAPARPPRRRAVIVAHADRDSLTAAIVLARDVRLLEGLWVYPQSDLMTFFRSVATGHREDTPIYLVGFTPSPSRDVLQTAALYSDRLVWFDHHEWPPEDVGGVQSAIGEDAVHLVQGAGSSLPVVLSTCTRRSRFSDKLVDLATGRFTHHDYERWGRVWWTRLAKIAQKVGDVRSDVDPLLIGRPSDLAREASRVPLPELPAEIEYVSRRDFRLVHFAGYALVVLDLEPEYDIHLASRIARERHAAVLSLAYVRGDNLMVLGGDELAGHRSLDFGAVVEHLAGKLQWVEALPDDDHVSRFRIVDLQEHPERLDEVIGTIAMGRSILER